MRKNTLNEIPEPPRKIRLRYETLPGLMPNLPPGFGVMVRIHGPTWVKWYRATTQAMYEEIVEWAQRRSILSHNLTLYSARV